ncbi:hypothetical protein [Prauserella endophytica]|uniref:hypothetical protein n=1 Tax=Prauserella endophytica TaxID=1592324 RepID=UPI00197DCCED|nr:hypothetical protein [Prauserella endophytica]
MDFESVADELYELDRDEFTPARDRRAAEARKAGDKDLATRIKGLRKPTSAAWLVNRLARSRPEDVAELAELGDALRRAHSELAGEDLRALSRRRHELVQTLTDRAAKLGDDKPGESVVREVYDTLDAALTDPESARAVTEGRLTSALRPGDAFAGDWMALGPAPARPERKPEPKPQPKRPEPKGSQPKRAEPKGSEPKRAEPKKRPEPERAEPEKPAPKRAEPKQKQPEPKEPEQEEPRGDDDARRLREERHRAREALSKARAARNDAARELRLAEEAEAKARKRTMEARKRFAAADERVDEAEAVLSELL